MKEQTNKARFWKLLEQFGYEVDDGERRIPVGPGRRPITKDMHGIADLVCIPPEGSSMAGILYFQVAYDDHDHNLHLEALVEESEKRRKLIRFLRAGNTYQVGSYNRNAMQTRRVTLVKLAGAKILFSDIEHPLGRAESWYQIGREVAVP